MRRWWRSPPDGKRFIAASHAAIDQRDAETGEQIRTLMTPPGRVLFAKYSLDGTKLLTGGVNPHTEHQERLDKHDGGWAAVIDVASGSTQSLTGHRAPVTCGDFSSDSKRCATGSIDRTIRLWDTRSGQTVHSFDGPRCRASRGL